MGSERSTLFSSLDGLARRILKSNDYSTAHKVIFELLHPKVGGDIRKAHTMTSHIINRNGEMFLKSFETGLEGGSSFIAKSDHSGEYYGIIYGPASVAITDKEGDLITGPALKKALPQLLVRKNLSLQHLDIQPGHILEKWVSEDGTEYRTEVRTITKEDLSAFPHLKQVGVEEGDDALFVVGGILKDTKYCKETWEKILKGELSCYSISGQAVTESKKVDCSGFSCKVVNEISEMALSACTICKTGMNQAAKFTVLTKGQREALENYLTKQLEEEEACCTSCEEHGVCEDEVVEGEEDKASFGEARRMHSEPGPLGRLSERIGAKVLGGQVPQGRAPGWDKELGQAARSVGRGVAGAVKKLPSFAGDDSSKRQMTPWVRAAKPKSEDGEDDVEAVLGECVCLGEDCHCEQSEFEGELDKQFPEDQEMVMPEEEMGMEMPEEDVEEEPDVVCSADSDSGMSCEGDDEVITDDELKDGPGRPRGEYQLVVGGRGGYSVRSKPTEPARRVTRDTLENMVSNNQIASVYDSQEDKVYSPEEFFGQGQQQPSPQPQQSQSQQFQMRPQPTQSRPSGQAPKTGEWVWSPTKGRGGAVRSRAYRMSPSGKKEYAYDDQAEQLMRVQQAGGGGKYDEPASGMEGVARGAREGATSVAAPLVAGAITEGAKKYGPKLMEAAGRGAKKLGQAAATSLADRRGRGLDYGDFGLGRGVKLLSHRLDNMKIEDLIDKLEEGAPENKGYPTELKVAEGEEVGLPIGNPQNPDGDKAHVMDPEGASTVGPEEDEDYYSLPGTGDRTDGSANSGEGTGTRPFGHYEKALEEAADLERSYRFYKMEAVLEDDEGGDPDAAEDVEDFEAMAAGEDRPDDVADGIEDLESGEDDKARDANGFSGQQARALYDRREASKLSGLRTAAPPGKEGVLKQLEKKLGGF